MNIDSIRNGVVIDHIPAGRSMQLYRMLGLDDTDCSVALIRKVPSRKMEKKDIIKIDSTMEIDLDVIGFVAPNATISVIRGGEIVEKKHIALPQKLVDIIRCKNPRCITTTEQEIHHIFVLTNREKTEYRCIYCDAKADLRQ